MFKINFFLLFIFLFGKFSLLAQELPTALFSIAEADSSVCEGEILNFLNLSTDADSLFWVFGATPNDTIKRAVDAPLTDIEVYETTTAGTFDVTLIAKNDFGSDTITYENYFTVFALPSDFFYDSWLMDVEPCGGALYEISLVISDDDIVEIDWFAGDNYSTVIEVFDDGEWDFNITLTNENGCSLTKTFSTPNGMSSPGYVNISCDSGVLICGTNNDNLIEEINTAILDCINVMWPPDVSINFEIPEELLDGGTEYIDINVGCGVGTLGLHVTYVKSYSITTPKNIYCRGENIPIQLVGASFGNTLFQIEELNYNLFMDNNVFWQDFEAGTYTLDLVVHFVQFGYCYPTNEPITIEIVEPKPYIHIPHNICLTNTSTTEHFIVAKDNNGDSFFTEDYQYNFTWTINGETIETNNDTLIIQNTDLSIGNNIFAVEVMNDTGSCMSSAENSFFVDVCPAIENHNSQKPLVKIVPRGKHTYQVLLENIPNHEILNYTVFNLLGQVQQQNSFNILISNEQIIRLPEQKGIYFIQIDIGEHKYVEKILNN